MISLNFPTGSIKTVRSSAKTIDTSGRDAVPWDRPNASDGNGVGLSGQDGQDGRSGQNAGHVTITCPKFVGHLVVKASGGRGANGQNGGNGANGLDGKNGTDGKLPSDMQNYSSYPTTTGSVCSLGIAHVATHGFNGRYLSYLTEGKKGTDGTDAGQGGDGGKAGQGGLKGQVSIQCGQTIGRIDCDASRVKDGEDGQPGRPGKGGKGGDGGRHGMDAARAFLPDADSRNPWFSVAGTWYSDKAVGLRLDPVYQKNSSKILGFDIVRKSSVNKTASDGKDGRDGVKQTSKTSRSRSNQVRTVDQQAATDYQDDVEAGTEAKMRAHQLAAAASGKQNQLEKEDRAISQQEAKMKALQQGMDLARGMKSSAERNQIDSDKAEKKRREAEENAAALAGVNRRIKEAFNRAESVMQASQNQRVSERIHKMVDQQAGDQDDDQDDDQDGDQDGDNDNDIEEGDDQFIKDGKIHHQRRTTNLPWFGHDQTIVEEENEENEENEGKEILGLNVDLPCIKLLDLWLEKFVQIGIDEDQIQTLSMLVQALVLQISQNNQTQDDKDDNDQDDRNDRDDGRLISERRDAIWRSVKQLICSFLPDKTPACYDLSVKDCQPLVNLMKQYLVEINKDVPLVKAFQLAGPKGRQIVDALDQAVTNQIQLRSKSKSFPSVPTSGRLAQVLDWPAASDPTVVLFRFRILPWSFGDLKLLGHRLFATNDWNRSTDFYRRLLAWMDEFFLNAVGQQVYRYLSFDGDGDGDAGADPDPNPNPDPYASRMRREFISDAGRVRQLLKELKQVYDDCGCSATTKANPYDSSYGKFVDKLVKSSEYQEYHQRVEQLDDIVGQFCRHKLELVNSKKEESSSSKDSATSLEKWLLSSVRSVDRVKTIDDLKLRRLFFLMKHRHVTVQELDQIVQIVQRWRRQSTDRQLDQVADQTLASIDAAFLEHYWKTKSETIYHFFQQQQQTLPAMVLPLGESIGRLLNDAMTWKFNRMTYTQRYECCDRILQDLQYLVKKSQQENGGDAKKIQDKLASLSQWIKTSEETATAGSSPWNGTCTCVDTLRKMLAEADRLTDENETKNKQNKSKMSNLFNRNKPIKFDATPWKSKIKRILYEFDRLAFDRADDLHLVNRVLNDPRFDSVDDASFQVDWKQLKDSFVTRWPSLYFLNWSKPLGQVDRVRSKIRSDWQNNYFDRMAHQMSEPTRIARRMDILLAKYNCQTGWFSSPSQSLEQWQSLAAKAALSQMADLEELLVKRILKDFPMMRMLIGHVAVQAGRFQSDIVKAASLAGVDIKQQTVKVDVVTALKRSQARKDPIASKLFDSISF